MDATGIFNPRTQIEGWEETAREEAEQRNDAMLGLTDTLCGLKVKPLTWRHLLWLDIYQSPFLYDAPADVLLLIPDIHLHIARFMWVLSPQWKPFSSLARRFFFWRYRKTLYGRKQMPGRGSSNTEEIVTAIVKFMDTSTWDLKSDSRGARRKSYYSAGAGIVHALCEKYGSVSPDPNAKNSALDVPVNIIGQLLRAHRRFENPKAQLSNRAEELERKWLAEYNEQLGKN